MQKLPPSRPFSRVEDVRDRLPEGTPRRRAFDRLFRPVKSPEYFTEPEDLLAKRLMPEGDDPVETAAQALETLEAAQAIASYTTARQESVERRATTLQGAVAIAASLLLAGAALLADSSKLHGTGWRLVFALVLVMVTIALMAAGFRALAASTTIHTLRRPSSRGLVGRADKALTESRIELAAETLKGWGYNDQVTNWKVASLASAASWFRVALGGLVALALLIGAYGVWGVR